MKWVIIAYYPHEPATVLGIFSSYEAALAYAEGHIEAYDIHMIKGL